MNVPAAREVPTERENRTHEPKLQGAPQFPAVDVGSLIVHETASSEAETSPAAPRAMSGSIDLRRGHAPGRAELQSIGCSRNIILCRSSRASMMKNGMPLILTD